MSLATPSIDGGTRIMLFHRSPEPFQFALGCIGRMDGGTTTRQKRSAKVVISDPATPDFDALDFVFYQLLQGVGLFLASS
ncbi:hypothetical protein [Spirosoma horti]